MFRLKSYLQTHKGMTLIELLTVILIIGILGVVLVPRLNSFTTKSQVGVVESDIRLMKTSLQQHFVDNPTLPLDINKIKQYLGTDVTQVSANGADPAHYTLPNKKDPWGNPYEIIVGNSELFVAIHSFGPDATNNISSGLSASNIGDDVLALYYPNP